MLTIFVSGLTSGIWFLGAMLPSLLLLFVGVWAYGKAKKREEVTLDDFMADFPPDIPTRGPEPEHRFASTIVRPPKIRSRKEDEDDDDKS